MSIRFFCSNCRQLLKARADKIGRQFPCPKCKKQVTVPDLTDPDVEKARRQIEIEGDIDPFAELIVYDDEIVYETEDAAGPDAYDRRLVAIPRQVLYVQAALIGLVAVVAFAAGYFVGNVTKVEITEVDDDTPKPVTIAGRVQWQGATGMLSDRGAVVIALPAEFQPTSKLAGEDFNPARPAPPAGNELLRRIESWGGQHGRTNDNGEFEFLLLPGRYKVLYVSGQAERPHDTAPSRDDLAAIGQYFTSPELLIGPFMYQWKMMEIDAASLLEHDFVEEDME